MTTHITNTLELIDLYDVYGDNLADVFTDLQNELSGSMDYENDVEAYYILLSDGIVYYDYTENITDCDKLSPHAFITLPYNPSELLVVNTVITAYNTLVKDKLPLVI